ncbi:MAG: XdhC/CoxI family protein [Acidobacteria bacterium]|nr:XdhC/CoxI family protein [Acidobacteriota bacterium]
MGRPTDVYEELVHLRRCGKKAALATIVEVSGSIPSFQSAKLLVREDGSMVGTIGGGCTEAEVWNAAREVMETEQPRMLSFNLGQEAAYDQGLICGGQLNVYVEPILPIPTCYIFGAGHISKSLSKVATLAGFRTIIVDDRETYANSERFPEAVEVYADEYETVFPKLDVNEASYIIIVTRGHRDDMRVLRWASSSPARYIGMIGSKRKTLEVAKQLMKDGVPVEKLSRLHAPMGFDIGAVTPEEIAVAVVGEMINRRRNPGNTWNPISKSIFTEGIPKALEIHEPTQVEGSTPTTSGAPTTIEAPTMEPVAAEAAAAKLPPLRRN